MNPGSLPLLVLSGLIVVWLLVLIIRRHWWRAGSREVTASLESQDPDPGRFDLAYSGSKVGRAGVFSLPTSPESQSDELAVPDELLPLAFADTCAGWTQLEGIDIALDLVPPPAANEIAWLWGLDESDRPGDACPKSCTMSLQAPLYA